MSADNVTPFPPKPSKPKKRKQPRIGLQFAEGDDDGVSPSTLRVYQGLRGVCNALDSIGDDVDLHADLSAAAAVLVDILEDRWL